MQVLQAANTGITSLQKLVDTAKSIANQVLQTLGRLFDQGNVDVTGTGAGVGTATAADLDAGKLDDSVSTFKTATGTLAVTIGIDVRNRLGHGNGQDARPTQHAFWRPMASRVRFDCFDSQHADLHLDQ